MSHELHSVGLGGVLAEDGRLHDVHLVVAQHGAVGQEVVLRHVRAVDPAGSHGPAVGEPVDVYLLAGELDGQVLLAWVIRPVLNQPDRIIVVKRDRPEAALA